MRESSRQANTTKLLALGLTLAAAGCGASDAFGVDEGRVRFVLSGGAPTAATVSAPSTAPSATLSADGDAAALHGDRWWGIQSANVTFSSVLARNLDGQLVDVAMELPVTLDVLVMDGGRSIELPDGELPAATYDQVVVVMRSFEVVTGDGTTVAVTPPGGGWTAIVPLCPFTVDESTTTTVGLQLELRKSLFWSNGRYLFQPRFRCETPDDGDEEDEGEGEGEG
jgi:hypothetical protein